MSSSSSVRKKKKKGDKKEKRKGKKDKDTLESIPESIPFDLKKKILEDYGGARRFDNNSVQFILDYDETDVFAYETTDFMITIYAVINFNADVEDQYINFVYNNLRRRFRRDPFTRHEIEVRGNTFGNGIASNNGVLDSRN